MASGNKFMFICQREGCYSPFTPRRKWQRYCSPTCANKSRNERNPVIRTKRARMAVTRHPRGKRKVLEPWVGSAVLWLQERQRVLYGF